MSRQRHYLEQSDYCVECLQETDISELNLVTGVCTSCKRVVKKLTKEQIERAKELLREVNNAKCVSRE
jgi:hypothetical protein